MKKLIDRKRYDTEHARLIYRAEKQTAAGEICRESLYRKRTGEFFLHLSGAVSAGSRCIGIAEGTEERIVPVSFRDALIWMNTEAEPEAFARVFDAKRGETGSAMTIWVSPQSAARLRLAARNRRCTVQELFDAWIDSLPDQ